MLEERMGWEPAGDGGRGHVFKGAHHRASRLQLWKENLWVGSDRASGLLFPRSFSFLVGLPPSTPAADVTSAPAEHVRLGNGSHVNRNPFLGGLPAPGDQLEPRGFIKQPLLNERH